MKIRSALLVAVTLAIAAGSADARARRPRLAVSLDLAAQEQSPSGGAAFTPVVVTRSTAESRWMLQPIADEYDRVDPYGFRLKLRGAGMKMRVPLSLH